MEKDVVTIDRKEYEEMQKGLALLYALEAAGVDNCGGWDMAMEILEEECPEYFDYI